MSVHERNLSGNEMGLKDILRLKGKISEKDDVADITRSILGS